ncbi:serine kinase [Maritimibacter sp. 55A14]|nr:serine kinase [Maritimibacter sp. 55A14]
MILHASAVALDGRGALIFGAAGSGKSGLALELMALGARLISDDRTEIALRDGVAVARAPAAIRGLIEARGVGLLRAEPVAAAPLCLAVDLDRTEDHRLPPPRRRTILGVELELIHGRDAPHLAAAIRQYLLGGRSD